MEVSESKNLIKLRTDRVGLYLTYEDFYPQGGTCAKKKHWLATFVHEDADGLWSKSNFAFDTMFVDEVIGVLNKAKELLTEPS